MAVWQAAVRETRERILHVRDAAAENELARNAEAGKRVPANNAAADHRGAAKRPGARAALRERQQAVVGAQADLDDASRHERRRQRQRWWRSAAAGPGASVA